MPDYQYIARELNGSQVVGTVNAASEREVLTGLATKNLFPVKVALAASAKKEETVRLKRVPNRLLVTVFTQMADLLRSGVPLLRSLELIQRQARHPTLKVVLSEVHAQISEGTRLADTFRSHPRVFNDLTVSMVRAGEEGGFLEDTLQRISDFTEHQEELKGRVVGAMVYPMCLLVLGTSIVGAMLIYFVPMFEPMFESMREQGGLPAATEILMALSDVLQKYWWAVAAAVVGVVVAARQMLQTDEGRRTVDRWRLTVPGLGQVTRSLAISRFCRVLGTLLKNGVPLLQSLRIAKDATGNRILSEAIGDAAENVSSGKSLAEPLTASKQFPADVLEMIAVGEEANNLEQVLINVADKMERQTNRQLDLVVRLLEPLMLVVMAGAILFVVIALMMPILQSSNALS